MTVLNLELSTCRSGSYNRLQLFPPPAAPPKITISAALLKNSSCRGWGRMTSGMVCISPYRQLSPDQERWRAPDRTSRLFRAVKNHRRRNLPRTPWDGLGVAESNRPPARKGGSILADQPMVFLPMCAVGGLRCAIQASCCRARSRTVPLGLCPDAAGSRPCAPSGCAGRYSGIILFVDFDGFLLRFYAVLPMEFH